MAPNPIQVEPRSPGSPGKLNQIEKFEFKPSNTQTTLENGNQPANYRDDGGEVHYNIAPQTASDIVTEVIHAEDDPTLNPWTFRTWFLGIGLSTFGGTLATIYYFKPQMLSVSTLFLGIISYVLGEFMSYVLPRRGIIGKLLNPHSFNRKEHAAIIIMSSTASNAPLAIEVLAVNKLYYDKSTPIIVGIILLLSSQCLGYGIAGVLRKTLTYPTKMLYPSVLSTVSAIEVLHGEKNEVRKRLRVFWIGFFVLFIWEWFPEYIIPLFTGISIFCLAKQDNLYVTRLFGGSNGNEGLGFLSICLDWNLISGAPMWLPLQTLVNNTIGYLLGTVIFSAIYYRNTWNSMSFPFLSQLLFTDQSNSTKYDTFNQTLIMDSQYIVQESLLEETGLPWFSGTFIVYLISTNVAITATFTHLLLWNYKEMKLAWEFMSLKNLKACMNPRNWAFWKGNSDSRDPETDDPHVRLMLAYRDAPDWWYGMVFVFSLLLGFISLYKAESTLPWWGFLISIAVSSICVLFFGAQYAITGFNFVVQPVIQMLGGYLIRNRPVANMYFTLFGYNSVSQGQLLLRDLKLGQYVHLSPRCTFTMQMIGTIVGSVMGYVMMDTITENQRDILLSISGTPIWSGQTVQTYNSQAIAWGGLATRLFSFGQRYQWVTLAFIVGFFCPVPFWLGHKAFPKLRLDYWNTAIATYFVGWLCVGINSSSGAYLLTGYISQFYLRKYRPNWFIKYNYILSAAMDGGTQVLVFITTFGLQGGAGKNTPFPTYWGNNQNGNFDLCMKDPAQAAEGGEG